MMDFLGSLSGGYATGLVPFLAGWSCQKVIVGVVLESVLVEVSRHRT